ncbi:hypothetical protein F5Y19DRAFT_451453 [Xylariaceae sp. FL1651]|nr:hypothetical protein F5Y19DRAFT_451453 [Xylariaceae sp. FL1651]
MNPGDTPGFTASHPTGPHSRASFGIVVSESPRPKVSYSRLPDVPIQASNKQDGANKMGIILVWLEEAKIGISQDLDTTQKELDIIISILEELKSRTRNQRPNPKQLSQKKLMSACHEYSSSRCHMLHERLQQVQSWSRAKETGQRVPERAPAEVSSCLQGRPSDREEN